MRPSSEEGDAARDMIALIRACHEGDREAMSAILGCVGEEELRAIAGTFARSYCRLA